ncbi:MAG: VWA domain-containing protein, partial [Lachnospiraceae bacterium]|nr:VWA domain-containing protein [Lachnospiraceae bacterium]
MKREKAGSIVLGVWLAFVLCIKVLAANDVVVAGVCTNEKDISLYVKGLGEGIMSVSCQIGTKAGQQVEFEDAAGMENAPKTLIMVDNSLSITDSNRRKIADFLTAFVGKKEEREQIAIAVFDEKIRWLTEFTQAGQELEAAAGSITYQDQETYLTDVLYEVIKKGQLGAEDCYKKIIVISDGVDNKAIGYTKEELYGQIEEKAYPIYTLGCVYKNNEEQLKNMFALSRMTGGKDFLLDEADSMEAVADEIREDSRAVRFCIIPDAEEMDGSINQVLLTVSCADG